jgi:hypothetical protein
VGDGHRDGVPAAGEQDGEGAGEAEPGAAPGLGHEGVEEAGLGDGAPEPGGGAALLELADAARGARLGEELLDGVGDEVVGLIGHERLTGARGRAR